MRAIGKSVTRVDAEGKVTGKTEYPGDLNMENQASTEDPVRRVGRMR